MLAVGCAETTSDPSGDTTSAPVVTEDIEARFGGYDTSDEAPAFGDEYLTGGGEQPIDDAMAEDPAVVDLLTRADVAHYAVRITWGYLGRDSSYVSDPVDWSGSAAVDTGAVVGRRTILFEPLQGDHVVRPRTSHRVIEWVSTTTVHFDGLQFVVLDPTDEGFDGTLTIDMPLYSEMFRLDELAELDVTTIVDADGHEVRIQARQLVPPSDPAFCRHGWLAGRWSRFGQEDDAPHGVVGRIRAHWTNAEGTVTGTLHGFYGRNRGGHRVLFGKLIAENGQFEALMRGTWSHGPGSPGVGPFVARLYDENREVIGGMRGMWQRRDRGEGSFMGGWGLLCSDADDIELDESIFETGGGR
jgi:hypothetical protein